MNYIHLKENLCRAPSDKPLAMLGPQIDPIELTFSKVSTWQTIGLLHNYTADTLCKFTPTDELGGNGLQAWVAPFNYINHVTSIRFSHHHFSPQRTKC